MSIYDLPRDVFNYIVVKLDATSICRCKRLCKRFSAYIPVEFINRFKSVKDLINTGDLLSLKLSSVTKEKVVNYGFRTACEKGHLKIVKYFHARFSLTKEEMMRAYSFIHACYGGNLDVVKWLVGTFAMKRYEIIGHGCMGIYNAAIGNNLEVIKWLHMQINITKDDILYSNGQIFHNICNLDIVKWLYSTFDIDGVNLTNLGVNLIHYYDKTDLDFVKWVCETHKISNEYINTTFEYACRNNINTAKFLYRTTKIDNIHQAFINAYRFNQLETAKWLYGLTTITKADLNFHVCGKIKLETIVWLCETLSLTQKDIIDKGVFTTVCRVGNLDVAKWIHNTFDIPRMFIKSSDIGYFVCTHGYLDVIKWLHKIFYLTMSELSHNGVSGFTQACVNGHLDMVKWIYRTHSITKQHVISAFGPMVSNYHVHLNIIKWLHSKFDLSRYDMRVTDLFCNSCKRSGNLKTIKWLYKNFDIDIDCVRNHYGCNLFQIGCGRTDLKIIQWLYKTFNISKEQIIQYNHNVFQIACQNNYLQVAKYLHRIGIADASEVNIVHPEIQPWFNDMFGE